MALWCPLCGKCAVVLFLAAHRVLCWLRRAPVMQSEMLFLPDS